MMNKIDRSFEILAQDPPASNEQLRAVTSYFGSIPEDYVDLVSEATEIELQHRNGQYIRIWGPTGCIDMDEGYGIRQRIPSAIPIGDDGGCQVIFYGHGKRGSGLYHVGYGDLDIDDAIWIAPSLIEFIGKANGIDSF